jgi:hypothetical protein
MDIKLAKVLAYLQQAGAGEATMASSVIEEAGEDMKAALQKQFNEPRRSDFTIRMSNIGKPLCQLQMDKAGAQKAPLTARELMNFLIGDAVEVVMKAILKSSDVGFVDGKKVKLQLGEHSINGTSDCSTDGEVDDIKTASTWAFNNKFQEFGEFAAKDSFGYVGQLVGYAEADQVPIGGWWAVKKEDGTLTYLRYDDAQVNKADILADMKRKVEALNNDEPFQRCFEDETETYYKKASGNRKLPDRGPCSFCEFRYTCWPGLQEMPSLVSGAKVKPDVAYTFIAEGESEDGNAAE